MYNPRPNIQILSLSKNKNLNLTVSDSLNISINLNDGFTMPTNKKHLSSSSSSSPSSPTTAQVKKNNNNNKKLFKSTNRFEILSQDEPPNGSVSDPIVDHNIIPNNTIKPPPPIFIRRVVDYTEVCTKLIELVGVDNFFCKSTADRLKMKTANVESYRALIRYLKDENAEYHSYQLNEDKPVRAVIRNLHPPTRIELIKEELEFHLFAVRRATNVHHRTTKLPLSLFFVDLEPSPKSNEILLLYGNY